MRLWHWKLIRVLPRQQLLGQWRECCLIEKEISENGTPNHILVDPVIDYPIDHFISYAKAVCEEMHDRGYYCNHESFCKHMFGPDKTANDRRWYIARPGAYIPFPEWHTKEYFVQCYYNLEEKHDRGGISDEEWKPIQELCQKELNSYES